MKRIFLIAAILTMFSPLSAKIFEIGGGFGFHTGKIREHVFLDENELSRLDWKTKIIPYFTVFDLRFDIPVPYFPKQKRGDKGGVILDADLSIYFPTKKTSTIDDWDFFYLDGIATHFSTHDLTTKPSYDFNIKAGYKIKIKDFSIIPMIGLMFRDMKFEGYDGYYQYVKRSSYITKTGPNGNYSYPVTYSGIGQQYWSPDMDKTTLEGNVISYEQKSLMPYFRIEGQWKFHKDWNWIIFTNVSPFIFIKAFDDHHKTSVYYLDEPKGGYSIKVGTEIRWKLLCIGFSYEHLDIRTGISGEKTQKSNKEQYLNNGTTPHTDWNNWCFYVKLRY